MQITFYKDMFFSNASYEQGAPLKRAGFVWDVNYKRWIANDFKIAEKFRKYCDKIALEEIATQKIAESKKISASASSEGSGNLILKHPKDVKPFPYQVAGVEYILPRPAVLLADSMGLGKGMEVNTMIYTPSGKKRIGDLKVGDNVIGSNGLSTKVIGVYPQGKRKLYRITFNDKFSVLSDDEHLWCVYKRDIGGSSLVLSTKQLLDKNGEITFNGTGHNETKIYKSATYYKLQNGDNKWQIPMVAPIEFYGKSELPINPYLLGLILGNGSICDRRVNLTSHTDDFYEFVDGFDYTELKGNSKRPNVKDASFIKLKPILESFGLMGCYSHNKFIPDCYKYSSVEERLSLLRGLMDTDGTPLSDESSGTEYCTVSKKLSDDVCEIVHSIGGIVKVKTKIPTYTYRGKKKTGKLAYRLNIKLPIGINPFRLKRKAEKYVMPTKYLPARYIKDIKYERDGESICIAVDSPDKLYVIEHGIVTHNTAQALLTMNMRSNVEAVIVCPSIVKFGWLKEAKKWLIGEMVVYIYYGKKIRYYKGRNTDDKKKTILHIINYDLLKKFSPKLLNLPYNMFVSDECHLIKNKDSERSRLSSNLAKKVVNKLFISGTPIYNKPKDLFVILNLIDPIRFPDFEDFETKYCGVKIVKEGNKKVKSKGEMNMDELNKTLRANYMIRRMKKDVMKDLPNKIKSVVVIDEASLKGVVNREKAISQNIHDETIRLKNEVNKMIEETGGKIKGSAIEEEYKSKVKMMRNIRMVGIGEIAKIRHEIAIKKVPYVVDFVKEALDENEGNIKVLIFGHHTDVCEAIYMGLRDYKPLIITGKTNDSDRKKSVSLFSQPNDFQVLVGSMGACSTGVDGLQKSCNIVVFAELDWTPSIVEQSEDRLLRIGQKNTVWVYHLVANDSLDSKIAKMMVDKDEVSKQILDLKPEQLFEKVMNEK